MPAPGAALQVNQPQVLVSIDGLQVPGVLSLEVESLGYFAADRFSVAFAIGASVAMGIDFFASLTAQTIMISLALGDGGFVTLLTGQIDNIRIELVENVALLSGRDLSALLIDTEISQSFANQTASQIAATIAANHGLTPNVTPTTTLVGQYYELDHARHALGLHARATTEWSLLCWLAQIEGFLLSVTDSVLNFGPPAATTPLFLTPQNFMTLTFDTATTIPGSVSVKSWNTRSKMVNAQDAGSGSAVTTLIRPNLSAAQAATLAENHLSILGQHTTILQGTMPGELTLAPAGQIMLSGTGSGLDQLYAIQAITRQVTARTGFAQSLRAYAVI